MAIYEYKGYIPVMHDSSYVHPLAAVIGNVTIGRNVYVGPGAAIRGDIGEIIIGDGSNVQENCTIHMFPGETVILEENSHIGHGAIVHGAHVGRNSLIGMNAVLMDKVKIGEECIIGALTLVPEGMEIAKRKVAVGNPAKVVKDVTDEMIDWKTQGTELYQRFPKMYHETLEEVEPLRSPPVYRPEMEAELKPLKETRKKVKQTTSL